MSCISLNKLLVLKCHIVKEYSSLKVGIWRLWKPAQQIKTGCQEINLEV